MMTGYGRRAIVVRVLAQKGKDPYTTYDTIYVDMRCGPDVDEQRHQTVLHALTHHFGTPDSAVGAVGLERYFDPDLSWIWPNVKSV